MNVLTKPLEVQGLGISQPVLICIPLGLVHVRRPVCYCLVVLGGMEKALLLAMKVMQMRGKPRLVCCLRDETRLYARQLVIAFFVLYFIINFYLGIPNRPTVFLRGAQDE